MDINIQIGERVISTKTNKVGTVTEVNGNDKIKVDFGKEEKNFITEEAFKCGTLVFENQEKQSKLDGEIKKINIEEEEKKKEEQEIEKNRIEQQKEITRTIEEEKKNNPKILDHPSLLEIRSKKGRALFLVCQNDTFDMESKADYLWAPNNNNIASHQEMALVKTEDIIVHHFANTIWAISVAKKDCYEGDGLSIHDKRGKGYVVEAEYSILDTPTSTKSLKNEKKTYGNYKYGPFDKNGNNNQGIYLTELSRILAIIFLELAIKDNPGNQSIIKIRSFL